MSESEIKNKNDSTDVVPKDIEGSQEKLKYPRAIPFIISNEFCERFNFYGMKTILVLYLTRKLLYDDDTATVLYHTFNVLVYFFCIFGAIIADSWWGKFKTILWLSMVYATGSTVIAIGAIESWNLPARALTILGLVLIALGSGGIKPCVSAFGGEQFKLPEQAAQLAVFFSLFYFSVNAGSLISTTVTPILREDIPCLGQDDCFPLAFGVPAVLMVISIFIFLGGKFLYKILPHQGNMLVKVFQCIVSAVKTKKHEKATNPREHWLEYAESAHGKKLVLETKILLNVLVLYLPLPLFWALFDQQGSRWTFQATRMSGDLGFWEIKPDQMQVINPLLILAFIPLYEVAFYPLLKLVGISRPLQKLTLGGIFAGVAFVISAIVEINLAKTYPILPKSNEGQLRFFNAKSCDYTFSTNIPEIPTFSLKANEIFEERYIKVDGSKGTDFSWTVTAATPAACANDINTSKSFTLVEKTANSFYMFGETGDEAPQVNATMYEDSAEKSRNGRPILRVLANIRSYDEIILRDKKNDERYRANRTFIDSDDYPANEYKVFVGEREILSGLELKLGGVYTLLINERGENDYTARLFTISEPNSMNMLWLIPQYVVMTLGEVMFSITGLQFSFTQAPESMKSVLQGCWMLTIAFGNLIVVIIAGAKFFSSQVAEFFLFAGLMFVDMIIFMWLARRYKAIPLEELDKVDDELLRNEEKRSPLDFGTKNDGFDSKE